MFHNGEQFEELELAYAGRTSVFSGRFTLPLVQVDYEVLDIRITASQAETRNFGVGRQSVKLVPSAEEGA